VRRWLVLLSLVALALAAAGPAGAKAFSKTDSFFTADDGVQLAVSYYEPTDVTRPAAGFPAVMVFHGIGGSRASVAPVAETFAMLETLYPGRIDLGVGRAPGSDGRIDVAITTSVNGMAATWQGQLARVFASHAWPGAKIAINDFGATPAVVRLRLEQALETLTQS